MNQNTNVTESLTEVAATINSLFDQSLRASLEFLEALNRTRASIMTGMAQPGGLGRMIGGLKMRAPCGCDIPPPCWMPVSLGDLVTFACAGGTGTLRVRVTNCSNQPRQVQVDTKQADIPISATPALLTLGPMQRGTFTLTAQLPATAGNGQEFDSLIWVRGCKDYFVRWTVKVASRAVDCCHEMEIDDCPDLIHHWYDHFYCARLCPNQGRTGATG
jgi:hypothetical protein